MGELGQYKFSISVLNYTLMPSIQSQNDPGVGPSAKQRTSSASPQKFFILKKDLHLDHYATHNSQSLDWKPIAEP